VFKIPYFAEREGLSPLREMNTIPWVSVIYSDDLMETKACLQLMLAMVEVGNKLQNLKIFSNSIHFLDMGSV